jgi:hypothetical protein
MLGFSFVMGLHAMSVGMPFVLLFSFVFWEYYRCWRFANEKKIQCATKYRLHSMCELRIEIYSSWVATQLTFSQLQIGRNKIFWVTTRSQLRFSELYVGRNWGFVSYNWITTEIFRVVTMMQLRFSELQLDHNWDFLSCNWMTTEIFRVAIVFDD